MRLEGFKGLRFRGQACRGLGSSIVLGLHVQWKYVPEAMAETAWTSDYSGVMKVGGLG